MGRKQIWAILYMHDVYLHAKFAYLDAYRFLKINTSIFELEEFYMRQHCIKWNLVKPIAKI
jgi:hypothetical protein